MKIYLSHYKNLLLIISCVVLSSLILYLPFVFRLSSWFGIDIDNPSFDYLYRNYDGLLYVIPAKTWYNPSAIASLGIELPLNPQYFAAHLPLYPLFIWFFAPFIGYIKSMIVVNHLATILLALFFYFMLKKFKLTERPVLLTLVFLFLPRFLVVRSIGAPESLFILLILLSLYYFEKNNYWLAGILGGLATVTKVPGILLFLAYVLVFVERFLLQAKNPTSHIPHPKQFRNSNNQKLKQKSKYLYIFLIPLALMLVFFLYHFQLGNFFAYWHTGGVIPMPFPYSAFNFQAKWIGTAWLEDIVFYFFLYAVTVMYLKDIKYRSFFYFTFLFFISTTFVQHRDISRYSLPMWPLACIAFERFFTSKRFLVAVIILLPAIYMYAWNFLTYNVMSINNWAPFL